MRRNHYAKSNGLWPPGNLVAGCAKYFGLGGMGPGQGAEITRFKKADASMQVFFDKAYGYVVFPSVGKGGFIVGGAHGDGWVYEQARFIGRASIVQLTVGAQIGGQSFMEVIFFKNKAALADFKQGNFELNAQISAVAVKEGASKDASYDQGVAVFTMPRKGLMAEATVGGQKFEFTPK
jgi:lipid-binding SYLF domain-containing protein